MRRSFGFTLTEVMIGVAVFAVISLGVYNLTASFSRGAKENITTVDIASDAGRFLYRLREELRTTTQFDWPPLKVSDKKMTFSDKKGSLSYVMEDGVLSIKRGADQTPLFSGLEDVSFYREQSKLLVVSIQGNKINLSTKIYMEAL
jgi:prepilin-type N-terminal cleavage/methylation domain-containing protein